MGKTAAEIQGTHDAAVQAARDLYQRMVEFIRETIENLTDDLRYAQSQRDAAALAAQRDPSQANLDDLAAKQAKVDAKAEKLNQAMEQEAADLQREADRRDAAIEAADEQAAQEQAASGQGTRCAQGAAGCGNGCGAMAAQAMQALECVVGPSEPWTLDPIMGPGGCKGVCDPIDPEGPLPNGGLCISEIAGNPGASTSSACWAVRCAPETGGAGGLGGACCGSGGITSSGAPELGAMCGAVDCAEGAPSFRDGRCTCSDPMIAVPGVPPVVPSGPRF